MGGFCNEVRCIMKKENNSAHNHNRGSFSGRIGYVLAVAGSAVGLGNIWRFPYLAAKYGGGIFLLIYILLTASFGYVLIMSETALGRMTRKSPVSAFLFFVKTCFPDLGSTLATLNSVFYTINVFLFFGLLVVEYSRLSHQYSLFPRLFVSIFLLSILHLE